MTKLTRLPDGRVDLEGWNLTPIDEFADKMRELVLASAQEALEWLFSNENEDRPSVYPAIYWDHEIEDPLEVHLTLPFNSYSGDGPVWSFTLGALIDYLHLGDGDEGEFPVERMAVALEGLVARLRASKGKAT